MLEIVDNLVVVQILNESNPSGIDIELLELGLKVTAFVDLGQENVLCLLDATSGQKKFDLVLRWNLHKLMDLRLHYVLP